MLTFSQKNTERVEERQSVFRVVVAGFGARSFHEKPHVHRTRSCLRPHTGRPLVSASRESGNWSGAAERNDAFCARIGGSGRARPPPFGVGGS